MGYGSRGDGFEVCSSACETSRNVVMCRLGAENGGLGWIRGWRLKPGELIRFKRERM